MAHENLHPLIEKVEGFVDHTNAQIAALQAQTAPLSAELVTLKAGLEAQKSAWADMQQYMRQLDALQRHGDKFYWPVDGRKPDDAARQHTADFFIDVYSHRIMGRAIRNTEDFKHAQLEGTDADGGFLLQPAQSNVMHQIIENWGDARTLFRQVIWEKAKEYRFPTLLDKPTIYYPDEGFGPGQTALTGLSADSPALNVLTAVTESKLTLARPTITPSRFMLIDTLSLEVIEDSVPGMKDVLLDVSGRQFAKAEDFNGLAAVKATDLTAFDGLLAATGVTSGVTTYTMPSTKTAFTDLTRDDLLKIVNKCNPHALKRAKWVMSTSILLHIRTLKDSNLRPLETEIFGPYGANPQRIFGFPVVLNEIMPNQDATAVSTPFILFGDFGEHAMGRIGGLRIDFHTGPAFPQAGVMLRMLERVGYILLGGSAIVRCRTAAS